MNNLPAQNGNRLSDYEPKGRTFESCRAHHTLAVTPLESTAPTDHPKGDSLAVPPHSLYSPGKERGRQQPPLRQFQLVSSRVAEYCGFPSVASIKLRSNQREHVHARQLVATKLRQYGWSYPRIGKALGGYHHTTVMHLVCNRWLTTADAQFLDSFSCAVAPTKGGSTPDQWLRGGTTTVDWNACDEWV